MTVPAGDPLTPSGDDGPGQPAVLPPRQPEQPEQPEQPRPDRSGFPARPAPFTLLAAFAAWLVPGLGHVLSGEPKRGSAFFALVAATFCIGLALGGRLPVAVAGRPLTWIASAASRGAGLLDAGSRLLGLGTPSDEELSRASDAEYGDAYLQAAAAMNLLLVVDLVARPRLPGGRA